MNVKDRVWDKFTKMKNKGNDKGGDRRNNKGVLSCKKRGLDNIVIAMNKSKKGGKK
jgi:hypothetical protein